MVNEYKVFEIICEEFIEIKECFNDERCMEIVIVGLEIIEDEDFIERENIVVILIYNGYIKCFFVLIYCS